MDRRGIRPLFIVLAIVALAAGSTAGVSAGKPPPPQPTTGTPTPMQVYGAWHCSDDYCTWGRDRFATAESAQQFDAMNHWLIDRDPGPGAGLPSVNLVVLSFVHPLKLLQRTTDATTLDGVPRGMTPAVVDYFTSKGVRVMVSIGGITYTDAWNSALAEDAGGLGTRAAQLATDLGVGVEIDYEENTDPNLAGLQAFIDAYRAVHAYDETGANPTARLTIDTAAGDRWLIALNRKATADWLRTDLPVLDYANAMVPARQPSVSGAIANWQEHIDGKPQYAPPVPPLAPAKFTAGLYVAEGSQVRPECTNFASSLQKSTGWWVTAALPHGAGTTNGLLGYMFWAAEKPSTRGVGTQPPNTCELGIGAGATEYGIPIGLVAPLRQQ
jgi:hypothetical protein